MKFTGRGITITLCCLSMALPNAYAEIPDLEKEPTQITDIESKIEPAPQEACSWLNDVQKDSDPDPSKLAAEKPDLARAPAVPIAALPAAVGAVTASTDNSSVSSGVDAGSTAAGESREASKIAAATDTISGRIVSDPNEAPSAIEELTRQILLKEIALEKFNLNYKLNVAKQGRWKGWRYALANEAANALGITGGIIGTEQRGSHLHDSDKVKNYVQERANFIPMIGTVIQSAAAILEFSINEYHDYEAYTKGFSPGKARAHVTELKNDINRLMAERDALVRLEKTAPLLSGRVEIDDLEGKALADMRDLSLLEYQRFHMSARRLLAFQQMQYLFDLGKSVTNGLGYDFGYLALHRRRRPWNYRAGILFTVSGALTIGGPLISRAWAKGISEYHRYYTKGTVERAESTETACLEKDEKAIEAALKSGRSTVANSQFERQAIFADCGQAFQDRVQAASKELDRAKLVATQNIGAGTYVGGSKIASGVLFIIPGYLHKYNINKNQTANRVTNHLLFASGVVGLQASSFSFLDTLRIQMTGEINRHKLAKNGKLPGQLIKARLGQLDAIEAKLNASKVN